MGFSLSNFLNTLVHENKLLYEQIELYVNYMCFFQISQKKQLKNIYSKIIDFDKEIDENININKTYSIDDIEIDNIQLDSLDNDTNNLSLLIQDKEMNTLEEPIEEEPKKEEPKKEEPKKEEPKKEEPKKEEPKKDTIPAPTKSSKRTMNFLK
jgi:hypothetical protein